MVCCALINQHNDIQNIGNADAISFGSIIDSKSDMLFVTACFNNTDW
jgi:hypothetical protein